MTDRTLFTGWWSPVSFFVNWFTIARNIREYRKIHRLEPPSERDPSIDAIAKVPLDPGPRLFQRVGVYFAVGVFVVMLQFGARVADAGVPFRMKLDFPTLFDSAKGSCVEVSSDGSRIVAQSQCNGPRDSMVTDVVTDVAQCPAGTDYMIARTSGDGVLCITKIS